MHLTQIHFTGEVSIYYKYKAYEDEMWLSILNKTVPFVIEGANVGKSDSGYLNYFDRLVSVPCCCFIDDFLSIIYTLVKLFQAQTNISNSQVAECSIG